MSEFDLPEGESDEIEDAFSAMETSQTAPTQGSYVQLRNGANNPVFVPLYEGEAGVTIEQALGRAQLTVGVVEFWFDNNRVDRNTVIPEGGVVEMIGNVKGG